MHDPTIRSFHPAEKRAGNYEMHEQSAKLLQHSTPTMPSMFYLLYLPYITLDRSFLSITLPVGPVSRLPITIIIILLDPGLI